jgi:hypothetical protein
LYGSLNREYSHFGHYFEGFSSVFLDSDYSNLAD